MTTNELEHLYRYSQRRRLDLYDAWKTSLEDGYDPNEEWKPVHDQRYTSPLFAAVLDENPLLAELLLDHGARLEDHNREGRTVLHEAVISNHEGMVLRLLARGANIGSQLRSDFLRGGTALHLAVTECLVDIVKHLLDHGDNILARTEIGWTPVDIAILDHQTTILDIFLTSVGLLTISLHAPDIELDAHKTLTEDADNRATATHVLEYGVRDTDHRHVLLFQKLLSRRVQESRLSVNISLELGTTLIRDMEALLCAEAGMSGELAWPRNVCKACKGFENQDSHNFFKIYEHVQDFDALQSSAVAGCNLCHFLFESLKNHWCLLHQIDRNYLRDFGVNSKVRLRIERRRGTTLSEHRLEIACGEKIAFIDLGHVQSMFSLRLRLQTTYTGDDRKIEYCCCRDWSIRHRRIGLEQEPGSCQSLATKMRRRTSILPPGGSAEAPHQGHRCWQCVKRPIHICLRARIGSVRSFVILLGPCPKHPLAFDKHRLIFTASTPCAAAANNCRRRLDSPKNRNQIPVGRQSVYSARLGR